jgi:hypothetical protein
VQVVIVGPQTRGPLEAALDALARSNAIVTVGARTAGATTHFEPIPEHAGWLKAVGEVLAADGESLAGVGLQPRIPVPSPEEDSRAWAALANGATLADVTMSRAEKRRFGEAELMRERNGEATQPPDSSTELRREPAGEQVLDLALQRALGIVTALRALGRLQETNAPTP